MSDAVATLGQRLKVERERKGLSAQKAADDLHLDGWVIEALESGDYARIGPSVYGKGHLKRYAGLLGLPADEILAAYDSRSTVPVATAQAAALHVSTSAATRDRSPVAAGAGIAAAALLIGLFWWKPWSARAPAGNEAPAAPAAAGDEAAQPSTAAAAAPESDSRIPVAVAQPVSAKTIDPAAGAVAGTTAGTGLDADPVAGLGRARLRLSFSADSWVDVHDAAGHRLFAGSGRANSVKIVAGDAPMKVYLGFASGVQVEINNRVVAIGPQFVAGNAARFEAGADGVLRRDVHPAVAGTPHPRG